MALAVWDSRARSLSRAQPKSSSSYTQHICSYTTLTAYSILRPCRAGVPLRRPPPQATALLNDFNAEWDNCLLYRCFRQRHHFTGGMTGFKATNEALQQPPGALSTPHHTTPTARPLSAACVRAAA